MSFETDQKLLQIYYEEAEEHVETLVQSILDMEQHGPDNKNLEESSYVWLSSSCSPV